MSRVTAPVSKLSRSITSASRAGTLLETPSHAHNAGAVLMPKYAELLRARNSEHSDSSRGLSTTHRPIPQPSVADRNKPLMQSFHSSSVSSSSAVPSSHLDATIIPNIASDVAPERGPVVPLLPDNYSATSSLHADAISAASEPPVSAGPSIVAANPDNVLPGTPLRQVEGPGLDGVDFKFAHERSAKDSEEDRSTMLGDIWRGMVDDVFGPKKTA